MVSSLTRQISRCIGIEVIIASLIAILTVTQKNDMVSLLFAVSFLIIMCYVLLNLRGLVIEKTTLLMVSLCCINVIMNLLGNNGDISFDYIKKLIMFSSFVTMLDCFVQNYVAIDRKVLSIVKYCPLIAGIMLIISYYYMGNTSTVAGGLTFGFANPNFAGMWTFHFLLYGCLFVIEGMKVNKWRLLFIPILVINYQLMVQTQTRSCFVSFVVFWVLLLLWGLPQQIKKIVFLVVAIFPVLYMVIYLNIVSTEWFQETFQFMVATGKTLTARVGVWNDGLEYFMKSPFMGDYFGISGGTGQSQMHNTHVDVMCSYGIIVLLLFIKLLYSKINSVLDNQQSFYQYAAICAFGAVIIQGSFEAAMVSGAMGMNLLTVGLLVLANDNQETQWETDSI